MLPVLKLAAQGDARVPLAADKIADELGLTSDERDELLPSGKQRILHNRVHWAKFYMSKAGLIENPKRGIFRATQAGKEFLSTGGSALNVDVLKTFPLFAKFYAGSSANPARRNTPGADEAHVAELATTSHATPEEQIDGAQALLHSALRTELLERILENKPWFFERVIVDLLVGMGYGGNHEAAAQRLGRSGDGGVDGVIDEDRLGLDRIYVQAKRYAPGNSVQRAEIQAFVGSLVGFGATKGVFVTTSSYTSGAREYVGRLPQRVILIDGSRLTELMVEHGVGVRTTRQIAVKRLDEDFFDESG